MSFMKYVAGGIGLKALEGKDAPAPIPPPPAAPGPTNTVTEAGAKTAIVPDLPKATDTTPKTETLGAA